MLGCTTYSKFSTIQSIMDMIETNTDVSDQTDTADGRQQLNQLGDHGRLLRQMRWTNDLLGIRNDFKFNHQGRSVLFCV
jgi:hypothetical protein